MSHFFLLSLLVLFFSLLNAGLINFHCPKDGLFANPDLTKCNTFIHCSNGAAKLQSCPWPLVFDATLSVCNYRTETSCLRKNYACYTGYAVSGNAADCTSYFSCDASQVVVGLRYCPKGLRFNEAINVCDWPANVPCDDQCTQNPGGAYTFWDVAETFQGCNEETLFQAFVNPLDNTFNSFVYCMKSNPYDPTAFDKIFPYIIYCCQESYFHEEYGWCGL